MTADIPAEAAPRRGLIQASATTIGDSMSDEKPAIRSCFIVLYRWRLHPGTEDTFVQGWSRITELLRSRGSLGSRLHRGSDGLWYSYAQWPSAQVRKDIFALGPLDEAASAQMRSAIAESFPEIVLDPIADYVVPLGRGGASQPAPADGRSGGG